MSRLHVRQPRQPPVHPPAFDYWKATAPYWAHVRAHWDAGLAKPPSAHLKTKIDGMAMIISLFGQAESIESGKAVSDAELDAVFAKWVEPATSSRLAREGRTRLRAAPACASPVALR